MKKLVLCLAVSAILLAQPPAGGQRRGPMGPEPLVVNATEGFESIFDGTLKG